MESKKKVKELKLVIILLIFGSFLLISYLMFTNYVQDKRLYPKNEDWFSFSVFQNYAPSECFRIEPPYLVFDSKERLLKVYTGFEKRCNFTKSITTFYVTDQVDYGIENKYNLTMDIFVNMSEKPPQSVITVNSTDMELYKSYSVTLYFKLKSDFYNTFRFSATGTTIDAFDVDYRSDLFGYTCEQDCFSVLEGNVNFETGMWRGRSKLFRFNDSNQIFIQSSPISRWWFLMQKVVDALVLGIMAALIYEIFNILFFREVK